MTENLIIPFELFCEVSDNKPRYILRKIFYGIRPT